MNHIRKKDHIYDVVVIGAGLAGLVTAVTLLRKGLDVCVLESTEFAGGHSRLVYSPLGLVDNGIKFFPDRESSSEALGFLNHLLSHPLEFGAEENGPVTYQNGEIKPFVGFGKDAPSFHRELSYFLDPRRLELSKSVGQVVADLTAAVGDRLYTGYTVTKYLGTHNKINSVMVNGQRQINGREFVHATSPKFLAQLLVDDLLPSRAKQKIAKANYWNILGLDIFHNGIVTERTELHLLNGTTQDELGPCVGLFHSAVPCEQTGGLMQHSQWMTFIEQEDGEDPETIGTALKKIKRQIKRAYPLAFENLHSERIIVAPLMEAELDLKFSKSGTFAGIDNLWLAHGTASQELNLVGSIRQAYLVAQRMSGANPEVEISSVETTDLEPSAL